MRELNRLLRETNYDRTEIDFLIDGFTNGFSIGYEGVTERADTSKNIPFTVGNAEEMWRKIMKEVKLGRFAGPFEKVPFKNYIQSPIGLVPKANNQTRLIFHLSYNFKNGNKSLNASTPKNVCTVKYQDIDAAVKMYIAIGKRSRFVFAGKSDLVSAFRVVPIKREHFRWLVLMAVNPANQQISYFVDKNLPFGASISCSHFQRISNCMKHIIQVQTGRFTVIRLPR